MLNQYLLEWTIPANKWNPMQSGSSLAIHFLASCGFGLDNFGNLRMAHRPHEEMIFSWAHLMTRLFNGLINLLNAKLKLHHERSCIRLFVCIRFHVTKHIPYPVFSSEPFWRKHRQIHHEWILAKAGYVLGFQILTKLVCRGETEMLVKAMQRHQLTGYGGRHL